MLNAKPPIRALAATLMLGVSACAPEQGKQTSSTAQSASPIVVARLAHFGEGLAFDRGGRTFVSDPIGGQVFRVDAEGTPVPWARLAHPNGHEVMPDGSHWIAIDGALVRLDAEGRELRRVVVGGDGARLRTLNDLSPDGEGGLYFTEPGDWFKPEPGQVHRLHADGRISLVADGLQFPNGVAIRPGETVLYVGESRRNRILAIDLAAPGPPAIFATLPTGQTSWTPSRRPEPDGMAFNAVGELHVAHFGTPFIRVFDRAGRLTRSIDTGALSITNMAARDGTLFVTVATGATPTEGGAVLRLGEPGWGLDRSTTLPQTTR